MSDFHRFDPQIQSEDIAFRPEEMVTCECGRANAPTRASCIYCGRRIATSALDLSTARPLEAWENGFNVIAVSPAGIPTDDLARILGIDDATAEAAHGSTSAAPVLRVAERTDAETVLGELELKGFKAEIVADETLNLRDAPVRLGSLDIDGDAIFLIDFNTQMNVKVSSDDLVLAVAGVVVKTRSESVEKIKRKSTTLLDESETDSRESVLDIYTRNDSRGFRIYVTGFDFSELGEQKGLFGEKNLAALIDRLKSECAHLKVVDDYISLRPYLDSVWPIERRTDALGQRSIRFVKSGFAKAETSSNLEQFNRFSRLQWHFL